MDNEMQQILDLQEQGIAEKQLIKMFGGNKAFNKIIKKNGYKRDDLTGKYIEKKELVTEVVIPSYKPVQNTASATFTSDEVDVLLKMIQEYKIKESIRSNGMQEYEGTLKNRNIRVYEEHYNNFSSWCKENNITQATALRNAIDLLMNSFK